MGEYGFRVHNAVATSMHDHVINFKADLDIAGANNSMVRIGVEPFTTTYPWDDDSEGTGSKKMSTMHLTHTPITTETGLDWPSNSAEMYYFGDVYEEDLRWRKIGFANSRKTDLEPDITKYRVPVEAGTNHSFADGIGFHKLGGPAPWN